MPSYTCPSFHFYLFISFLICNIFHRPQCFTLAVANICFVSKAVHVATRREKVNHLQTITLQSSKDLFEASHKFAVLIDADNTTPHVMDELIHEISRFGSIKMKRIYGDWGSSRLSGWRTKVMEHALVPIQQMAYTVGKGSTDSALIIDAMDIFYTQDITGFCLVSSDSDFTRLALRLREGGKLVFGVGERKTPKAFVSACNKFVYIENLNQLFTPTDPDSENSSRRAKKLNELIRVLQLAADDSADVDGWCTLSVIGDNMIKVQPDFDPRNYGFKKLSDLVRSTEAFELKETSSQVKVKPKLSSQRSSETLLASNMLWDTLAESSFSVKSEEVDSVGRRNNTSSDGQFLSF